MHFRIFEIIATSGFLTALECTKFDFSPAGGAYSAPPDPLAGLREPTSKGRWEKGTAKEGGEEREEVGEGQGTGEWKVRGRDAREKGGKKRGREEGEEEREGEGR